MKNILYTTLCCTLLSLSLSFGANNIDITRIDPPNWWVGMKDTTLQLCIYVKNISASGFSIAYPGIQITHISKVENPNYLFVDLAIARNTMPGTVWLKFKAGSEYRQISYSLLERESPTGRYQGYNSTDLIYQLMPDRFADGDASNDVVTGMRETKLNRDSMFYRHGGDLQGIMDHLDYIKTLGATGIWLTPVQENDQKRTSYHGYAITDHYKIDPRYGSNALYTQLVQAAHAKGLKVIMDMVYNHTGSEHWFIKDLPTKDWIHQSDTLFITNYRVTTLMDPHASAYDKHKMSDGWFVKEMPDLNQQNPFLSRYLIQNSIWWIETSGIDGFRIDTYAYSDLQFMSNLMAAVKNEYASFMAVGELWDHDVSFQAYMMQHPMIEGAHETNLPGLIDFQLCFAVAEALNKPMDWTGGLAKLYYVLAQDFLYRQPENNLIFLDNHDMSRFYSVVGADLRKFKMGVGFLLTTRGIPCIYYGTEILMKNFADPDGKVRADFPGGWPGDTVNKFTVAGRSREENEAYFYINKLAHIRRQNPALQTGKLTQFVPENDTYVYFRSNDTSTFMVVMHYGDKEGRLPLVKFSEMFTGYKKGWDVMNGKECKLDEPLALDPFSIQIIELER